MDLVNFTDMKAISPVFRRFKSNDMLEISLLSNKHFKPLYLVSPKRGGKLAGVGFYILFFLFFMTDLTNFPNFLSFRFFSKYDIS